MIRKSHAALPSLGNTLTRFLGAALCAGALAAPAQAGTIGFDIGYAYPFGNGDTYTESGYKLSFGTYLPSDPGTAVGMIFDGTDPTGCYDMACPTGNPGQYFGAINDSIVWLTSETNGARFNIKSFDASFIGLNANLATYPALAGLLRIQGWLADGSWVSQDFALDGPGATGFTFGSYIVPDAFSSLDFVEAALFGFTCSTSECVAFETNRGQFGLDNLELADVPEPASALLFGLGLAGLVAGARRRTQRQAQAQA